MRELAGTAIRAWLQSWSGRGPWRIVPRHSPTLGKRVGWTVYHSGDFDRVVECQYDRGEAIAVAASLNWYARIQEEMES